MSLKYRNQNGVETSVAGLNGTSGELVPSVALMKSGVANVYMPNTSSLDQLFTVQVTFDTPFEDANYVLNVDQCEVSEAEINRVFDRTASGFYIAVMYNRKRTEVPSYNVTARIPWQAFKLMTDEVHEADSVHIAQNTANFAPAFSEVTSYAVGDYVTYNNILYRCTTAHTAGVWVAGHFTQVTVGGEVKKQNGVESNVDFNTLTTPGVYSSAGANSPESGYWYTVTVQNGYINGQRYILQFASSTVDTNGIWRRVYNGSTWSSWQKLVTESTLIVTADGDNTTAAGTNVASTWRIISNGSLCICHGINTEAFNTSGVSMTSMQLPSGYVFDGIISANVFIDGNTNWVTGTSHVSGNGAGTYITGSGLVTAGAFRQIVFAHKA